MFAIAGGIILAVAFFLFLPVIISLLGIALCVALALIGILIWLAAFSANPEATLAVSLIVVGIWTANRYGYIGRFKKFIAQRRVQYFLVLVVFIMPVTGIFAAIVADPLSGLILGIIFMTVFGLLWRFSADRVTAKQFIATLLGKD